MILTYQLAVNEVPSLFYLLVNYYFIEHFTRNQGGEKNVHDMTNCTVL